MTMFNCINMLLLFSLASSSCNKLGRTDFCLYFGKGKLGGWFDSVGHS